MQWSQDVDDESIPVLLGLSTVFDIINHGTFLDSFKNLVGTNKFNK